MTQQRTEAQATRPGPTSSVFVSKTPSVFVDPAFKLPCLQDDKSRTVNRTYTIRPSFFIKGFAMRLPAPAALKLAPLHRTPAKLFFFVSLSC